MIKQRRHRRHLWPYLLLLMFIGYVAWALLRPMPEIRPNYTKTIIVSAAPSQLVWPRHGQAAASTLDGTVIATHGEQKPQPMASTAKVITSLVILEKLPLKPGESGPTFTLNDEDVRTYERYVAQDGSVIPVQAGVQLTQYQMLQAIMLPSANNIADGLAIRAYGSLSAYAVAANQFLNRHGIYNTRVGSDASGLAPDSVSTPSDLIKIGKLAMADPVLSTIASQQSATGIPLSNEIRNVNFLLGTDGIVGIKTGTSDQAGGAFLGAAKRKIDNKEVVLLSAVMGAPDRISAINPSRPLLNSAGSSFQTKPLLKRGQTVGQYKAPWGETLQVISQRDVLVTLWQNEIVRGIIKLNSLQPNKPVGHAGYIALPTSAAENKQTVQLVTNKPEFTGPDIRWRLLNPW